MAKNDEQLLKDLGDWLAKQPRRPGAPIGPYRKHGVSLHTPTVDRAKALAKHLGYDFKDAVNEGLQLWIEKRSKDLE